MSKKFLITIDDELYKDCKVDMAKRQESVTDWFTRVLKLYFSVTGKKD